MPPADLIPPGTSAVPAPPNPNVRRGTATCAVGREARWREHAEEGTPGVHWSWLRVSRRADASRMRPGGGQQLHTSAVRSEQCVRLRGSTWARMRVLAVFFCPHAPDLLPWCMSVLSHDFKRFERCTKLATSSIYS
jgi:hypothetical protein